MLEPVSSYQILLASYYGFALVSTKAHSEPGQNSPRFHPDGQEQRGSITQLIFGARTALLRAAPGPVWPHIVVVRE